MATVRRLGLFPSCVTDFTGWSQDAAVAAFWRVKNWRIASSSGVVNVPESEVTYNVPPAGLKLYYKSEIVYNDPPQLIVPNYDERNLICSSGLEWKNWFLLAELPAGEEATYNLYDEVRITFSTYNKQATLGVNFSVLELGGTTLNDGAQEQTLVGSCFFNYKDGYENVVSVEFPIYSRYDYSYSLNLTFEVGDYWPYDPGDGGGPIYDSATGNRLRESPAN